MGAVEIMALMDHAGQWTLGIIAFYFIAKWFARNAV
jgi:hypothetical protein